MNSFFKKIKINKGPVPYEAKGFHSGFTIVEVLVALAIFSLSVIAMLVTLSSGISSTDYVKKKITATYLAQEGIEYMRNVRDNYMLFDAGGWDGFAGAVYPVCQTSGTGCNFDDSYAPTSGNNIKICPNINDCKIYAHLSGGYGGVQFVGDIDFGMQRIITTEQTDTNEVTVTVTVLWNQGGQQRQVVFTEYLFNWYPNTSL